MITCSRLPLALTCPQSQVPPAIPIDDGDNEPARLGTAAHDVLAGWVRSGVPVSADIAPAAEVAGVDAEQLSMLCWQGWRVWREFEAHFPAAHIEERIEAELPCGVMLGGTPDVFSLVEDEGRQLLGFDFKTGRVDEDHEPQFRGYGYILLRTFPEAESVYFVQANVRQGGYDSWLWSRAELEAWAERAGERLESGAYNPTRRCGHCRRQGECPAYSESLMTALEVLGASHEYALTPETLGSLHDRRKLIETLCEKVAELERAAVIAAGGKLDIGEGRFLELRQIQTKEIDAAKAGIVLGAAAVLPACRVSKGKLEAGVKASVQRGKGAAAIRETMQKLDEAGAIIHSISERLEVTRNGERSTEHAAAGSIGAE